MKKAVNETKRRRKKQFDHNQKYGITPMAIVKEIKDIRDEKRELLKVADTIEDIKDPKEQQETVAQLEKEMHEAADNLEFELAAVLRIKLKKLIK